MNQSLSTPAVHRVANKSMGEVSFRDLCQWHGVGVLATVVVMAMLAEFEFTGSGGHYTQTESVLIIASQAAFFLIVGTPVTLPLLWMWTRLAGRWPTIEANMLIRLPLLALFTVTTAVVCLCAVYVALDLIDENPFQLAVTWNNIRANLNDLKIICGMFAIWALVPRVVLPSLRGPVRFKRNTFA